MVSAYFHILCRQRPHHKWLPSIKKVPTWTKVNWEVAVPSFLASFVGDCCGEYCFIHKIHQHVCRRERLLTTRAVYSVLHMGSLTFSLTGLRNSCYYSCIHHSGWNGIWTVCNTGHLLPSRWSIYNLPPTSVWQLSLLLSDPLRSEYSFISCVRRG